jgi:hypothetical protein
MRKAYCAGYAPYNRSSKLNKLTDQSLGRKVTISHNRMQSRSVIGPKSGTQLEY